jgi:Tol biopolymer transport system component
VPAGDSLVIGTVVGDPVIVVRDIQDPANAKNLCTIDAGASSPQFVAQTSIAYETTDLKIIQADLTNGNTNVMATYHSGFGSGQYSISSDGKSVTYIDGNAWHLAGPSGDKVLTTLPPVPARGVGPDEDDSYLGFSPDGKYIALFQTFHTGGTGETAPDQIRRATDGGLVYSTSGMTMAVWASVPSRLYFRDGNGAAMHRWDAASGVSNMTAIKWIRPRSSPDGRWIAYTFRTTSGLGGVGLYSVQANSISNTTPPGRSGVKFLTNDLIWYVGERACSNCIGPELTGQTYIYSIAGASEVTARLSAVYDAWPHFTAPGVG